MTDKKIIGVIPSRYASSRFPGKPLADILGKPMVWWVYQQLRKVKYFSEIYVATDDNRIKEVCEKVLGAIENPEYGFILVNFANPDMVGHTGVIEAAAKACKVVDECVGKIAESCKQNGVIMLLTADHGNAEVMVDESTGKPHTAHTTNEVPFVVINGPKGLNLKSDGALCNIAPTVLELMGIKKPEEMTAESLIK